MLRFNWDKYLAGQTETRAEAIDVFLRIRSFRRWDSESGHVYVAVWWALAQIEKLIIERNEARHMADLWKQAAKRNRALRKSESTAQLKEIARLHLKMARFRGEAEGIRQHYSALAVRTHQARHMAGLWKQAAKRWRKRALGWHRLVRMFKRRMPPADSAWLRWLRGPGHDPL